MFESLVLYNNVLALASNMAESVPRITQRQTHRTNPPRDNNPSTYYRRAITIPLIDHLISQLDDRFTETNIMCVKAISIVPDIMIGKSDRKNLFLSFVEFYRDDMLCICSVESEIDICYTYWTKYFNGQLPSTVLETDPQTFPNIVAALKILAVLPFTTRECELTISTLRRLNTRSAMDQERMNGLAHT